MRSVNLAVSLFEFVLVLWRLDDGVCAEWSMLRVGSDFSLFFGGSTGANGLSDGVLGLDIFSFGSA